MRRRRAVLVPTDFSPPTRSRPTAPRQSPSSTRTATRTRSPISRSTARSTAFGLHHRQRLLQEGQPERRPAQLSARRHRLGPGDRRSTSTWSQRHVPGLQADPGRSQQRDARQPRRRGPHRGQPRRDGDLEQLRRQRERQQQLRSPRTTTPASRSPSRPATAATASSSRPPRRTSIAVGGTHLVRASNARGWTRDRVERRAAAAAARTYASRRGRPTRLCTKRTDADVSALAIPNTGVAVYDTGQPARLGWMVFGGTSVSAPLIGGVYGLDRNGPDDAARIPTRNTARCTT